MNTWRPKDWGTDGMNKAIETYLEAGAPKARPTCEGVARDLERKAADPKDTINIHTDAFAYGSPRIGGARNIITGNISPCVTVSAVARNEKGNLGFMAHLWAGARWRLESAAESMSRIAQMGVTEVIIFGGEADPRSAEIVAVLEGYLMVEDPPAEVVGRDVLRGFISRDREIGLDTKAEEPFFTPTNWLTIDCVYGKNYRFGYEGAHVAPIANFLSLIKRK